MLMVDYDYVEKPGSQGNYGENTALLSVCSPCPMISVTREPFVSFVRAATAPTSASTTAGPSYSMTQKTPLRTMACLVGALARTGLSFRIRRVEAFTLKEAVVKSPPDARPREARAAVASWRILPCSRGVLIKDGVASPGSPFVLQKNLQQLERHLAVAVDDAPRVARNAPRP